MLVSLASRRCRRKSDCAARTTSAFSSEAEVGIALDVAHGTDTPGIEKKRAGDFKIGGGPIIARGANINPRVFELLVATAEAEGMAYQIGPAARGTGTDANAMQLVARWDGDGLALGAAALHAYA